MLLRAGLFTWAAINLLQALKVDAGAAVIFYPPLLTVAYGAICLGALLGVFSGRKG